MQKRLFLQLAMVTMLAGCGGGGDRTGPTTEPTRLVGEIFGTPAQIANAEIVSNVGYGGNRNDLQTSRAIQQAGKANMLDFLFMFPLSEGGKIRLADNASKKLDSYIAQYPDLLVPGVRLYLIDEMYLAATLAGKNDAAEYNAQLNDLVRGVALVREKLPTARIGISFSPHATFGNPAVLPFIRMAIAQVDWVGSTSYWMGDPATVPALHEWSRALPGIAKTTQPRVETWYIAQAFRDPSWDRQTFREYMQTELQISDSYDAIIFFGWQEVSELSGETAGQLFEPETRAVYRRFLKQ